MDMSISGMKTLVISVCKKKSAVVFQGTVKLKLLLLETKIKPFE